MQLALLITAALVSMVIDTILHILDKLVGKS